MEIRSRVPRLSTSSSAADFEKQACFKRTLFLTFLPSRLFAWFPFIRPGLLGRGNDSSKTPSRESGTVSKSQRLTPGYYWIRLGSLVAPFLPTWWSSRESEASVTTQPNTLAFTEQNKPWHKKMTCTGSKKRHVTCYVTFKWAFRIW